MAKAESAPYSMRAVGGPALTNPGVVGVTNTGGEIYVETNQTGGTAHYIADAFQGGTPTPDQIKAGQRADGTLAAVSASVAVNSAGIIGPYRVEPFRQGELVSYYWVHTVGGLDSNVVGGTFRVLVDEGLVDSPDTLTSFYNKQLTPDVAEGTTDDSTSGTQQAGIYGSGLK